MTGERACPWRGNGDLEASQLSGGCKIVAVVADGIGGDRHRISTIGGSGPSTGRRLNAVGCGNGGAIAAGRCADKLGGLIRRAGEQEIPRCQSRVLHCHVVAVDDVERRVRIGRGYWSGGLQRGLRQRRINRGRRASKICRDQIGTATGLAGEVPGLEFRNRECLPGRGGMIGDGVLVGVESRRASCQHDIRCRAVGEMRGQR